MRFELTFDTLLLLETRSDLLHLLTDELPPLIGGRHHGPIFFLHHALTKRAQLLLQSHFFGALSLHHQPLLMVFKLAGAERHLAIMAFTCDLAPPSDEVEAFRLRPDRLRRKLVLLNLVNDQVTLVLSAVHEQWVIDPVSAAPGGPVRGAHGRTTATKRLARGTGYCDSFIVKRVCRIRALSAPLQDDV